MAMILSVVLRAYFPGFVVARGITIFTAGYMILCQHKGLSLVNAKPILSQDTLQPLAHFWICCQNDDTMQSHLSPKQGIVNSKVDGYS